MRTVLLVALFGVAASLLVSCTAVRPYEREYLADRIMDAEGDAREERLNQKWLEAREGSTGGASGAGGGCACN
jgi:hypothetical protein